MIGQQVFLVVLYDRHSDTGISVHLTREGADDAIAEFQALYADRNYTWHERNYGAPQWVRYVDAGDDGPRAYIELSEVRP